MNLVVRVILGAVAIVALAVGGWYGYDATTSQPIRSVHFAGELDRLDRDELERLAESLRALPEGGASLTAVREASRHIRGVRDATVRRRFPDAVVVTLEPHVPLAHWTEGHMVSLQGEVYAGDGPKDLPRFTGPEGTAGEMAREYPVIAKALQPLGVPLAELRRSPRGAWQAVLADGFELELGRTDIVARLERFVAAWPRIAGQEPGVRHVDLRYPNGFALRRTKS